MVDLKKEQNLSFIIDGAEPKGVLTSEEGSLSSEILSYLKAADSDLDDAAYSNKKLRNSGRNLRRQEGNLKEAESIVRQYRAAHQKPLDTVFYILEKACVEAEVRTTSAKRLKRLGTIIDKLQRRSLDGKTQNAMCITNMGDIGGCRFVFETLEELEKAKNLILRIPQFSQRLQIKSKRNYIQSPKENDCGYRSIHLIIRYETKSSKRFFIEVQLRTRQQHLWATAIEIVDVIEGTSIKNLSHAPNRYKEPLQIRWEKLFRLVSDLVAHDEGVIELTSHQFAQNGAKLRCLEQELDAIERIRSFNMVSQNLIETMRDKGHEEWVVLVVDVSEGRRQIDEAYIASDKVRAVMAYSFYEKTYAKIQGKNVLMVSVTEATSLSNAYPNYVGDGSAFIDILQKFLDSPENLIS